MVRQKLGIRACQHTLCLFRKFFQWFLPSTSTESTTNPVPLDFTIGILSWTSNISPFFKAQIWVDVFSFSRQVGWIDRSLEGMTWYRVPFLTWNLEVVGGGPRVGQETSLYPSRKTTKMSNSYRANVVGGWTSYIWKIWSSNWILSPKEPGENYIETSYIGYMEHVGLLKKQNLQNKPKKKQEFSPSHHHLHP